MEQKLKEQILEVQRLKELTKALSGDILAVKDGKLTPISVDKAKCFDSTVGDLLNAMQTEISAIEESIKALATTLDENMKTLATAIDTINNEINKGKIF